MNINELENVIIQNYKSSTSEFKRLFHGRGGCYENWEFLTVDSIDSVLYIVYFSEIDDVLESELNNMYTRVFNTSKYSCIILQRRYLLKEPSRVLFGEYNENIYALESNMKYKLNLLSSRNTGFFADMKNGREFVYKNASGKRVLNLFSYSCSFSISALKGGAESVVNVDMSKGALSLGRTNHHLNELSTKKVKFMPYNILKSWNRIKKAGPYDLIIIDPPTFQKGSFIATNDYDKIIKKLSSLSSSNCTVLAATNSPDINPQYIVDIFDNHASEFKYVKRLNNLDTFPEVDSEKSLKNLIFERGTDEIN